MMGEKMEVKRSYVSNAFKRAYCIFLWIISSFQVAGALLSVAPVKIKLYNL